jgi:hypothetical protein
MRQYLILIIIVLLAYGHSQRANATDIQTPIDNEMKASIVAAKDHFHSQACVSDGFKTSLEEFETYWTVTLTDDGREGAITCEPATVYVCKSNARVVLENPLTACSE